MQKKVVRYSSRELFGEFSTWDNFLEAEDGYEFNWDWPREIGTGHLSMIKFRSGVMLGTGSYNLSTEVEVDFSMENPFWCLGFNVSGSVTEHGSANDDNWDYEKGQGTIFHNPEWKGTVRLPVHSHVGTVTVYMTPEYLRTALKGGKDDLMPTLLPLLDASSSQSYSHPLEMTPTVCTAINQILSCPYKGIMSHLYLEGKTLELLTYSFSQFFSPDIVLKKSSRFSDEKINQIHLAKELIGKDLQSPPGLQELAREVGLSHATLNQCFRDLYGTTIFGYLRELRLDRAKALLEEGGMNVTEVAYEVGYSSLSHFAKSFKQHHGISPGSAIVKQEGA